MAITTTSLEHEIMFQLCPGWVVSDDGDKHYISAEDLIRLYGIQRRQCILGNDISYHNLHKLEPRVDGKYRKIVAAEYSSWDLEIKVKYEKIPVKPPLRLVVGNMLC